MGFVCVVELFPPLFPYSQRKESQIDFEQGIRRFIDQARSVGGIADIILIADVKDPNLLKLSAVEAAVLLKERAGIDAAPVLVLRDSNRKTFLSSVLTCFSLELGHLMFAWGDDYLPRSGSSNVRDFTSLAQSIGEAAQLRRRARMRTKFLAPVNVERLSSKGEGARARDRLRAGAEYLLAQPPTTDLKTLERHGTLLRETKLWDRVLLNVFPFKDSEDVRECEAYFGWRLPKSLRDTAEKGHRALFEAEREVVGALRDQRFAGIYLNTRGTPGLAKQLLS
jgi:5,10-methylenetetrahydrofolate reductase